MIAPDLKRLDTVGFGQAQNIGLWHEVQLY
jgi:hypothetical protein